MGLDYFDSSCLDSQSLRAFKDVLIQGFAVAKLLKANFTLKFAQVYNLLGRFNDLHFDRRMTLSQMLLQTFSLCEFFIT